MSAVDFRFDDLGVRANGTAAVSGGAATRALGATAATKGRKAINVRNHSTTDGIRVYFTTTDDVPTISATACDHRIPPNESRVITAGATVRIWLISESASNTCAFTAVELV